MTISAGKKSTIVRARRLGIGAGFRAAEVLAPTLGARAATRLWFTIPPPPRVSGLPGGGEPFTVMVQQSAVRGFSFGSGPTIYLMHGWGGLGAQLGSFVEPLRTNGFRVVLFDAPAHGASDPGPSGPGRSHGLEFSRALEAVANRFGPAHTVIAHSMGAVPALLAQQAGELCTDRLVFLAPMRDLATYFDRFAGQLGFGRRVREAMTIQTEQLVGYPVAGIDLRVLSRSAPPVPLLVVHDQRDRETFHEDSVQLVANWAGPARLVSTEGLGHRRILVDQQVVDEVVSFVRADPGPSGDPSLIDKLSPGVVR
jgi:pimeloyl-ACP methyl ester carboxylesterase